MLMTSLLWTCAMVSGNPLLSMTWCPRLSNKPILAVLDAVRKMGTPALKDLLLQANGRIAFVEGLCARAREEISKLHLDKCNTSQNLLIIRLLVSNQ